MEESINVVIRQPASRVRAVVRESNAAVDVVIADPTGSGVSGIPLTDYVVGEVPTGVLNGSNALFTSLHEFIPETLEVMVNGMVMKRIADYNTTGRTQIQLTFSPQVNETITINYIKY